MLYEILEENDLNLNIAKAVVKHFWFISGKPIVHKESIPKMWGYLVTGESHYAIVSDYFLAVFDNDNDNHYSDAMGIIEDNLKVNFRTYLCLGYYLVMKNKANEKYLK